MSNNDIENAYKQMLKESGVPEEDKSAVSASRSLADELIDTVGELDTPAKKVLMCPECKGTDFHVRSPLGSTRINVCVGCNTKVYSKKKPFISPVETHAQGTEKGPYYSPEGPKPTPDKFTPKFKLKSKSRKEDD